MRPNKAYKNLKKAFFSVPIVVVLAVIVAMVGVAAFNMYRTYRDTNRTVKRLEAERAQLADRKRAAESAAAQIATKRGLKEEIREKFSVAKPGERVIVLTDNQRRREATSTRSSRSPWWQQVLEAVWPL